MSETLEKPPVMLLRSTSRNFPLDMEPELTRTGAIVVSLNGIEEFIASSVRSAPFVALMEIGSVTDLERAYLVYEWVEHTQPLAPARYILLLASKNLPLGERLRRFSANTEITMLPQPPRNLIFKLELQQRLLKSRDPSEKKVVGSGFAPQFEAEENGRGRILVARGPNEKVGDWRQGKNSPQGKIRWRWVRQSNTVELQEQETFTWIAECQEKPNFDKGKEAWILEGENTNILCYRGEEEILSAVPKFFIKNQELTRDADKTNSENKNSPKADLIKEVPPAAEQEEQKKDITPKASPLPLASKDQNEKTPELEPKETPTKITIARAEAREPEEPAERAAPVALRKDKEPAAKKTLEKQTAAPTDNPMPSGTEPPQVKDEAKIEKEAAIASVQKNEIHWGYASSDPRAETLGKKESARSFTEEEVRKELGPDDDDFSRAAPLSSLHSETVEAEEPVPHSVSLHLPYAPPKSRKEKEETEPNSQPMLEPKKVGLGQGVKQEQKEREPKGSDLGEPSSAEKKIEATEQDIINQPEKFSEPLKTKEENPKTPPLEETLKLPPMPSRGTSDQFVTREGSRLEYETIIRRDEAQPDQTKAKPPSAASALPPSEKQITSDTLTQEQTRQVGDRAPQDPRVNRAPAEKRTVVKEPINQEEDSRRFLRDRLFLLMTLKELNDRESSWHIVGSHRIYISAQHRYYGLPHPAEVLPLWIYHGELAPEFVDEIQSWKFYDRLPQAFYSLSSLPIEVLEYVYKMAGLSLPGQVGDAPAELNTGKNDKIEPAKVNTGRPDHYLSEETKKRNKTPWGSFVSFLKKIFNS